MNKRTLTTALAAIYLYVLIMLSGCINIAPSPKVTPQPTEDAIQSSSHVSAVSSKSKFGKISFDGDAKKNVLMPFEPVKITPKVTPYTVSSDLSNVANVNQFGTFTDAQKALLTKNAFVVSSTQEEQLFHIYEKNEYLKIPNFITTDSVLQVYHVFYDYSLRKLESDQLIGLLEQLTQNMLDKSLIVYNGLDNPVVKSAAQKNAAVFAVAHKLLGKDVSSVPAEVITLAEEEIARIIDAGGFQKSAIFPYNIDYSQFKPRGHYTRTPDLERFFRAMMWYGQAPFPLYLDAEQKQRNSEQTLQALLIAYTLFLEKDGKNDVELWDKIYEPTVFYVGKSDDLTIYEYENLLREIYGDSPDLETLDEAAKLDALYAAAQNLPEPRIQAKYSSIDTPVGKQFRFMGQRYIPDSEIIGNLVEPVERPIPSGLDVLAALGSKRAYDIQMAKSENAWLEYPSLMQKQIEQFAKLPESTYRSNMYYGWLWTLRSFADEPGNGYPSFMTNQAWMDKSLNTALGSWSELRHDTILYGKQSGAECGGEEAPKILGYVEPSVGVYDRLLWLTRYSKVNLESRGLLSDGMRDSVSRFEDLLNFLISCSMKELNNEELTQDEYNQLLTYGGLLEYLTTSLATDGELSRWYEVTSETDKSMSIIADFHTVAPSPISLGGYMETGVGPAQEIFVVVPIGGKLVLTRGAVFSTYEFLNTNVSRMTDEEWQAMIKAGNQPNLPDWMNSFISNGKQEIPEPVEPYNSGC